MDTSSIRKHFPELERLVYGKKLVYLDNAATSLRPVEVTDLATRMSLYSNANLSRAVHAVSNEATAIFEDTRKFIAERLNAESGAEIVFTSGVTAAINLVAFSFCEAFLNKGDEIIISELEHHSNLVPWQLACQRKGASLKLLTIDDSGHLMTEKLPSLITEKTRLVCVSHISNVLGIINPVKEIVRIAHSKNVPVFIDGAQGIVHTTPDVKDIDCDFYAFSGHKVYAMTGTGVLYAKRKWLEAMPPYMSGGEMIREVKWSGSTWADLPFKFEAGTQNISGIPTLVPAFQIFDQIFENQELKDIKEYIYSSLCNDGAIVLRGTTDNIDEKIPLFSFSVEGVHHEDLALILDKMGIAVRSGQMCAEPLMDRLGVTGLVRASFAPYNTMEEARYFMECLHKAVKMLQ